MATEFMQWVDTIKYEEFSPKISAQEILVQTIDTVRYSFLLQLNIDGELPCLFCGPTGTGKSIYIKNTLNNKLDLTKFQTLELGFSAQTTCTQTQEIMDNKLDRRRKGVYGPKSGKCIVFIDDLNMPAMETYGA